MLGAHWDWKPWIRSSCGPLGSNLLQQHSSEQAVERKVGDGDWGSGTEGALAEGKGVLSRALRVSGQGPGGWEVVPIGAEGSELGFQGGQS